MLNHTNTTAPVRWVSSPQGRGTYDVLLSCFFTLLLASWTALHMNMDYSKSKISRFGSRICLVLLCIVFPECMLLRAIRQLHQAIQLRREINKRLRCSTLTTADTNVTQVWTLTQAFWIVQSGLAVKSADSTQDCVVVTPEGALRLAELQLLPYISEDEIASRSKSDAISKMIVIAQGFWFLVQLIGRVASVCLCFWSSYTRQETHSWRRVFIVVGGPNVINPIHLFPSTIRISWS